jgi:hypothetical protein
MPTFGDLTPSMETSTTIMTIMLARMVKQISSTVSMCALRARSSRAFFIAANGSPVLAMPEQQYL